MEANKENCGRLKPTRIPLPLQPLPPLPKHLVDNNKEDKIIIQRAPLKTINTQAGNVMSLAGPSKLVLNANRFIQPLKKLDIRHVTQRKRDEQLDWNLRVFQDKKEIRSVISISDDDDKENSDRDCIGAKAAVTPNSTSQLESIRVRNIKRSLKRPHSREIQGLSPVVKKRTHEKFRRRLNFNESFQSRLQSPDIFNKEHTKCLIPDYFSDIFVYLMAVERKPPEVPRIPSVTRACVLNWLMKINGPDGNPAVIQSACWYLDSILASSNIDIKKLQLVAAACYWIAQKLYGPAFPASKLVHYSGHAFTSERLLTAEKVVLQKLKFPPQPVVPQDFITYLSWWCDHDYPGEIQFAATFLSLSGIMVDKNLSLVPASVIGAAAVRNALLLLKKEYLMKRLNLCPEYKAAERKATNITSIQSLLRKAVRIVASFNYEYKTPYEHYDIPPQHIAQRIVSASNELAVMDTRILPSMEFGASSGFSF